MSETILELVNISKQFPGVKALDNVCFDIKKNEIHGLIGENGAGKSTLMKILSGIYQADAGDILLHKEKKVFLTPVEARKNHISIIHQELNLCNNLRVYENIFSGREPVKKLCFLDNKKALSESKELFRRLGVNIPADAPLGKLSISQKQMVEIAKSLSENAKILIMDEPTSALTEHETQLLFKIIDSLREAGVSIIYISHKLDEIMRLSDRITVLRDGRTVAMHNKREVTVETLITEMVGREITEIYPKRTVVPDKTVFEVKNINAPGYVNDVSFQLRKGEILGLSGLVGAGRTELVKTIFGAVKKNSGKLFMEEKEINIERPLDAIHHGIGLVTENRKEDGLCLGLSVGINVLSAAYEKTCNRLGLVNKVKENKAVMNAIARLNIKTPSTRQLVKFLSGGNQQKIAVGKWLLHDLKVLILDEPTRGIDVGSKYEIYTIMNELTANGVSIIMISSELPEILGMSDRILVMRGNHIVAELSRSEADQESIMRFASGGNRDA
ncbi:MAG: sugar ABC transporter ATP-binding protein [Synergistaceae bacterium]|jgi:ribose transport system ATP-binding protein|nr:sugar ABC transporter ATP-binding protein [Synergistaceae bacterium]